MVKGITHILINDSAVQSEAGRNKADTKYKVYPVVCPEPEKFPYSVVRQTGKVPEECKGMVANTYTYSYDVISFHDSYDRVTALDLAVVAALSKPNNTTANGVAFQYIRHTNTRDDFTIGDGWKLYAKISSFEAMVDETVYET